MTAPRFTDAELQRLATLIVTGLRSTPSRARRDRVRLMADVAVVVAENPAASGNAVVAQVHGRPAGHPARPPRARSGSYPVPVASEPRSR